MRGRLTTFELESAALRGNPLGDPHTREVVVYLPPGYDEGTRRYPVLLLLPGFGSAHRNLLNYDRYDPGPVDRFDALVAAGRSAPALLVLPDAGNRWGGSQFVDSAATGAYQTFLADEVVPAVDARFRTVAAREGRGVVGRSSGGFGALRLGIDRPDVVAVVGSHAGDAAFDLSLAPMFPGAAATFARAGGLAAFAADVPARGPRTGPEHEALFVLAALAAYCPDAGGPFPHVQLPYDPRTLELDEGAWGRCLAHDPQRRLDARPDALRGAALVFLDAGDADEHALQFGARRLARTLSARGTPVVHEEFPGGHRGTTFRYDRSWPLLSAALAPG